MWEEPVFVRFLEGLASFSRSIWLIRLETGVSDATEEIEGRLVESAVTDMVALLDELEVQRAVVLVSPPSRVCCSRRHIPSVSTAWFCSTRRPGCSEATTTRKAFRPRRSSGAWNDRATNRFTGGPRRRFAAIRGSSSGTSVASTCPLRRSIAIGESIEHVRISAPCSLRFVCPLSCSGARYRSSACASRLCRGAHHGRQDGGASWSGRPVLRG